MSPGKRGGPPKEATQDRVAAKPLITSIVGQCTDLEERSVRTDQARFVEEWLVNVADDFAADGQSGPGAILSFAAGALHSYRVHGAIPEPDDGEAVR